MAIQIQFRRGTAAEWTNVDPILAEGEMGIETDTNLFKIGNGNDTWTELPYGGLRGFVGSTGYAGSIGNQSVQNVLYVSKSGDDTYSGTSLNLSKLTIKAALQVATNGTTIFVKSGDYTEINPLTVPEGVAVVGDSLRTVTVRPQNKTQDLFYVNNGAYLAHMTFKDHENPSAAVAFDPNGSAGVIHTSPYVQNCTSMTTTGTGMRVDGAHCSGLRSMVVDAYTQYNQGGIGIHHLNRGNTQLVSVFTICCDVAVLCESGGFCSLTNSNSSFGNYGLKADGVSSTLYSGKLNGTTAGRTFIIDNLTTRPNVGDAVKFAGDSTYYTLATSTAFTSGSTTISSPSYATEPADARNARQNVLDAKSKIQVDVIDFLNETYPDFDFNQFKCSRDVGLIIDAVVDDMVLNTNYKSIQAGISYYRATASEVTSNQKIETIAGINFARDAVLDILSSDSTQGPEYTRVQTNFNTITNIIDNGVSAAPAYEFNDPTGVSLDKSKAKVILQANRSFFIEEGIAYITENYSELSYNSTKCRRDIGYIIDSITYDILYGGNSQTADAADEYYSSGTLQVPTGEKQATIDTFAYLKTVAADCLINTTVSALNGAVNQNTDNPAATNAEVTISNELFDIVTNLIDNAYSSTITLEEIALEILDNTEITFHQFSLITAAGQTFEWVGAGTNVNTALPYLGGIPVTENQVVTTNQGKIYYTGTDQRGDFRIGDDLVINRNTGTITGRTFTKSLFAVMTPYILAIGD
jgi:hypothetical protein